MKFFKGYKKFMFSVPNNEKTVPEYMKKENKNLWYLPSGLRPKELKGKIVSTNFKGNWFIGEVITIKKNYVEIEFPKGYEKDSHWARIDEIYSIKA